MKEQLNSYDRERIHKLYLDLLAIYGPFISSKNLPQILGYPTATAFRQAIARKTVPVPLLKIDQRKGRFAKVEDIAEWAISVGKQQEN